MFLSVNLSCRQTKRRDSDLLSAPRRLSSPGWNHIRLRQILTNLIGNALKFTQLGTVHLEVTLERPDDLPEGLSCRLRFAIIDSGIGIPQSKTQQIFEPFMQADGSVTREFGGTGLGLAITKSLVELMGGKIEVASVLGKGSTFPSTRRLESLLRKDSPTQDQPRRLNTIEEHRSHSDPCSSHFGCRG